MKFHFPSIKLRGCFFHFKQAVGRWIFKNGYKVTYTTCLLFQKWFRKLTSLAVCLLEQIKEAWDIIVGESSKLNEINVKPILNYFEKTWMNGDFPPEDWNQFDNKEDRTNNYVESYNNQINRKLKTKPSYLKFCDFMIGEENKMDIGISQSDKESFYMKKQSKMVSIFHL